MIHGAYKLLSKLGWVCKATYSGEDGPRCVGLFELGMGIHFAAVLAQGTKALIYSNWKRTALSHQNLCQIGNFHV